LARWLVKGTMTSSGNRSTASLPSRSNIRTLFWEGLRRCPLEGFGILPLCHDNHRCRSYPDIRLDFLGHTFCPRRSKNRSGESFIDFTPASSLTVQEGMCQRIHDGRLHLSRGLDPHGLGPADQSGGARSDATLQPVFPIGPVSLSRVT
jgi:hypothetical protein